MVMTGPSFILNGIGRKGMNRMIRKEIRDLTFILVGQKYRKCKIKGKT